ncbi:E1 protein [Human papillomavirus 95]|uniref:Replication protein E1 n=1 Tax=Human papillomavirus 95 TaxID=260716 RepID=Q705D7_9PAPI|nr:E1 protein [Human papillomavirus 95]
MADKGTENFDALEGSSWYFVEEAECIDSIDTVDELFDESTDGSNISNLIDDDEVDQGNSLALYNTQITDACENAIAALKRKYTKSPQQAVAELSPQLQAVRITPDRKSKRRLFEDSGICEDEAENSVAQVVSDKEEAGTASQDGAGDINLLLLQDNNRRATMLAKFKDWYGVSYTEITRLYKSDKSCSDNWVVVIFKAPVEVLESSKIVLQQHCQYIQVKIFGFSALYLLQFKSSKSRETVYKLLCSLLNIQEFQILADPPKLRSVPAALYFYKHALLTECFVYGQTPDWIAKQTIVSHQSATTAETFELSRMVQWAYDNNHLEECDIAYHYALYADEDANAAAYLKSNNQVKHVKDCSTMVRMYKRYEMREMSMSEWIHKCCNECPEEGDWKPISHFLKYQGVNILSFLIVLKSFLKGIPKKNCILIHGPPDTGKSLFCYSLIKFLRGKVVSYVNRTSQFWLQPLMDGKIGFLDDATYVCWTYIDQNLRNALDGNPMSIDAKHRAPQQLKLPPMLITSNINVKQEQTLMYLHSRVQSFEFPNKMPFLDDGSPLYTFTDATWKSFFEKLGRQLDLSEPEEENNGVLSRTFRCTSRRNSDSY